MLAGLSAVAVDAMFSFANERVEHSIYMTLMAGIIVGMYAQETLGAGYKTPKRILVILASWCITLNRNDPDLLNP